MIILILSFRKGIKVGTQLDCNSKFGWESLRLEIKTLETSLDNRLIISL